MTDRKCFLKSKRKTSKLLRGDLDGGSTSSDRYDIDVPPLNTTIATTSSESTDAPSNKPSLASKPEENVDPPESSPRKEAVVEGTYVSPAKVKARKDGGTPSKSPTTQVQNGSPERLTTGKSNDQHVFTPPRPPRDQVILETRMVPTKTKTGKRDRCSETVTSPSSSSGGADSASHTKKRRRKKKKRKSSDESVSPGPSRSTVMSPLPYASTSKFAGDSDEELGATLAKFTPLKKVTSGDRKSRRDKGKSSKKRKKKDVSERRITDSYSSSPPPPGRRPSQTKRSFPRKKLSEKFRPMSTADKVQTIPQQPVPREENVESDEDFQNDDEADDIEQPQYPSDASSDDSDGDGDGDAPQAGEPEDRWRLSNEGDLLRFTLPDFIEEIGPTFKFDPPEPELAYFNKFITIDMLKIATRETNKYQRFHEKFIAKKRNPRWTQVSDAEMAAFVGCTILMGVDRKPSIEDYWSNSDALYNVAVSKVMTRSRFQMIRRYFHIADPYGDPRREADPEVRQRRTEEDPLYKINRWLGPMVENCLENYKPHQQVSIDEGMVKFKGRSVFKQRMPQKPDKDGFKIWQVADSITSYVCNFEPYLGIKYKSKKEGRKKQKGAVKQTTLRLCGPMYGKNQVLYVDSLFAKIDTALELKENGVFMVGSFRRSRKNLPPQLVPTNTRKKYIKLDSGQMLACSLTHPDDVLNITAYQDRKTQVFILNTVYYPLATINATDDDTVADDENEIPVSLARYRRYMGGVDRANQKRKYYHTGRKNNRYWTYLVWYMVDVALVNSYECYKHHFPETKLQHKFFNINVAKQLIGGFCSRNQRGNREATKQALANVIQPENMALHKQVKFQGRQKGCKECSSRAKLTPSGRVPETIHGCEFCGVHLHKGKCFASFHHRLLMRGRRSVAVQVDIPRPPPMRPRVAQPQPVQAERPAEPRGRQLRQIRQPPKAKTPSPPGKKRKGKKRRS